MYYWKIWRETRVRFFALLVLGFCAGWTAWSAVSFVVGQGFEVGQALPAEVASRAWTRGMDFVMTFAGVSFYFMGLVIGASGLGEEMERGTAVFLLTRPRSRGYFVWSFWLACACELLASTAITMLAAYVTLFYLTGHAGPWTFLMLGPIFMITGLLTVGLSHLLTTASRRSKNVVAGGVAFSVTFLAVNIGLKVLHKSTLPWPGNMYSLDWNAELAGVMLGWLAVSLAFVAASHLIVTRMEV